MANIDKTIPSLKLNDGTSMPMLAYGTGTAWMKKGDGKEIDKALVESLKTAIKMEYVHLDGAQVYKTEPELGQAIKESGVAREKLYVVTKVWNDNIKDIEGSVNDSLKKLQVDYVDLLLIHSPFFASSPTDLQSAWSHMESIKSSGKARSIGVSNYQPKDLQATLQTATIPPSVNQIEFHPYLQQPEILALHKQHNIATVSYGPLTPVTKAAGGPVDAFLASLAKKYAVNEAEILLRWCVDQDVVPVTTSSKEQRLSDYLRIGTFKLTPVEVNKINELGREKHFRGFWTKKFEEGK